MSYLYNCINEWEFIRESGRLKITRILIGGFRKVDFWFSHDCHIWNGSFNKSLSINEQVREIKGVSNFYEFQKWKYYVM